MSSVHAVLFDLDGVLVDTYEAWLAVVREAARRFGAPEVGRSAFDATWGQSIEEDTALLVPGATVADVAKFYDEHFPEHLDAVRPGPDAAVALAGLRSRAIPSACVTNSPLPLARAILRAAGLEGLLDTGVGAGEAGRPKPAPDMVLEACRRLGVPPGSAVLVGDSRFDREAAAAAGVPFALYDVRRNESLARTVDGIVGW